MSNTACSLFKTASPGLSKLYVQMPDGNIVSVVAPCKEGDQIKLATKIGSLEKQYNIKCEASGALGTVIVTN